MFENFKEFCERELYYCFSWGENPQKALDKAHGALLFVLSYCSEDESKQILEWWENDFRERFYTKYNIW